jgi:hypothetical protein
MDSQQKDILRFRIAKAWVNEQIGKRRSYADAERYKTFNEELRDKDFSDARVLLKMIFKEVDSHNSKIKSKLTLLENMNYKRDWLKSKVFNEVSSIPIKQIDKLIEDNPDKDYYEIYRILIGRF